MKVFRWLHKIKNKPVLARWLFYLGLFVYLIPVYLLPLFPTLDGAAHLYSASLMARWNDFPLAHEFFLKQPFPPPNIISHWLMYLLWPILHPIGIEKIIVALSIALPAISVEWLCRQKGISSINALLVLPVLYNFMLFLGFYNFLIGIGLLWLSYAILTRLQGEKTIWIVLVSLGLGSAMHFSHLMILPAATGLLFIDFLVSKNRTRGTALIIFSVLSIVSILLFYNQFVEKSDLNLSWPSLTDRLNMLWNSQPLVSFYQSENLRTRLFSLLLLILLVVELWRVKRWSYSGRTFGLFSALVLVGLMVIPDDLLGGGLLAQRIQLVFIYGICITLIMEIRRMWQRGLILLFILSYGPIQLQHQVKIAKDLSYMGSQMYQIGKQLDEDGILVPVYFTDNWLESHAANYAGLHRNIIIADFYEALNPYFPFYYNPELNLFRIMGMDTEKGRKCPEIEHLEQVTNFEVTYILNIKKRAWPDDCNLGAYIDRYFELYLETDDVQVYKRHSPKRKVSPQPPA